MWSFRKDEEREKQAAQSRSAGGTVVATVLTHKEAGPVETHKLDPRRELVAHIGKSVIVKGELSGSEDLYLDGEIEGTINLDHNSLTIGPNGRIHAHLNAREVIVQGRVEGNIHARERVELRASAVVTGDILTQRVVIEDGAYLKGAVDTQRETKPEMREAARATASAGGVPASAQSASPLFHAGLPETKK